MAGPANWASNSLVLPPSRKQDAETRLGGPGGALAVRLPGWHAQPLRAGSPGCREGRSPPKASTVGPGPGCKASVLGHQRLGEGRDRHMSQEPG